MKHKAQKTKHARRFQASSFKFHDSGFTLVETLIYAAITTMMLSFAILTTYQLISGVDRGKYERELVENQKFLEQKIYWALQSASAINTPGVDATTTSLSVNKLNYGSNPVVVDYTGDGIARIQKAGGSYFPITNGYSRVQILNFHQFLWDGRPAIHVTATLVNNLASTTASIDTTIITR